MPHRYASRIYKHLWLNGPDLRDFYWQAQPHIVTPISDWLGAWYRRLFLKEARPQPILLLFGPNGLGKTEYVARGIAKYHVLNLACASIEFVHWGLFIDDQLNGQYMRPNWDAKLLFIDDFDSRRPIPRSLDTWVLDKLGSRIKRRAEVLHYPTVMLSNRNPTKMHKFLSTSSTGDYNADTEQSARTLLNALGRHTFALLEFTEQYMPRRSPGTSKTEYNQRLVNLAHETNDMSPFHILERYGGATIWKPEEFI